MHYWGRTMLMAALVALVPQCTPESKKDSPGLRAKHLTQQVEYGVCECKSNKCSDCTPQVATCESTPGCDAIIECIHNDASCNLPHECSAQCESGASQEAIDAARHLASCFGGCDDPPAPEPGNCDSRKLELERAGQSPGWQDVHHATDGNEWTTANGTLPSAYIEYDLGSRHQIDRARLNEDNGGNKYVDDWYLEYWDGSTFTPAFPATDTPTSGWNEVTFEPVVTDRVRLHVTNDTPPCGDGNLFENATFDENLDGWLLSSGTQSTVSWTPWGSQGLDGVARFFKDGGLSNLWDLQLRQVIPVQSGETYRVSFDISLYGNSPTNARIIAQQYEGDWTAFGSQDCYLPHAQLIHCELTATMSETVDAQFGIQLGELDYWDFAVDNARLERLGAACTDQRIEVRGFELYGAEGCGECGNGIVERGEACDDGNLHDGDGCSSTCSMARLGCLDGRLPPAVVSASSEVEPAENAFDEDATTAWQSDESDAQWFEVDLGEEVWLSDIIIQWGTSASAAYDLQVSQTGAPGEWTTIRSWSELTDAPRVDQALNLQGRARFVRIESSARTGEARLRVLEMEVRGDPDGECGDAIYWGSWSEWEDRRYPADDERTNFDNETPEETASRLVREELFRRGGPIWDPPDPGFRNP